MIVKIKKIIFKKEVIFQTKYNYVFLKTSVEYSSTIIFTEKLEHRLNNFLNQQRKNVTESRIEPETFPLQEGRFTIRAISVRSPERHISALYWLAFHPILYIADLKDERKKFLEQWKTPRN